MSNEEEILLHKIALFRRKYNANLAIKGTILFLIIFLSYFISIAVLEYFGYFNSTIRTLLFISSILVFVGSVISVIIYPLYHFMKHTNTENLANEIGKRFPNIEDKLLNTILLMNNSVSELAIASLAQRTKQYEHINFSESIEIKENLRWFYWLLIPLSILLFLFFYDSSFILSPTERIINYDKQFEKPAPFRFIVDENSLNIFENEEFKLTANVEGSVLPAEVFVNKNGVDFKMTSEKGGFSFNFGNISSPIEFYLFSAGVKSKTYTIKPLLKASLLQTQIQIHYPKYTNKKDEIITNKNNITIPEGSVVKWNFKTRNTTEAFAKNNGNKKTPLTQNDNIFSFDEKYTKHSSFGIELKNENGYFDNENNYNIQIINDLNPKITVNTYIDTVLYSYINLSGIVSDDYGIKKLKLVYKELNNNDLNSYKSINIPISNGSILPYNFLWSIDTLISQGNGLSFYLETFDNDAINGSKSTKSMTYTVKGPDQKEINEKLKEANKNVDNSFSENKEELKNINEDLENLQNKIKSKKELSWEDKKELKNILEKQDELKENIEKLKQELENLNKQNEKFGSKEEELMKKQDLLQNLVNELLDDETKKLIEELQKLLEEQKPKTETISNKLEELEKNEVNLEKELDRALELFKQLKMEQKVNSTIEKLDKLAEKQKEQSESTKTDNPENSSKKQEELNKAFEELQKDLKEIEKLNQESKGNLDEELKKQEQIANEVKQNQQNSMQNMSKGKKSQASSDQKEASDKMEEMKESLQSAMQSAEEQENEENLENLRRILENLVKISYEQENLAKTFKKINQVDPKFVEESAKQIKIKEDAQIIEDSLFALASRVFEIKSFVTNEVFTMNDYIDKSLEAIKDRTVHKITGNQQFAMTSMNNLALLLSNVQKQMQEQMAKSKPGEQNCSKPGGKKPNDSAGKGLSQMQKELSKQIQDLKKSGQQGSKMSESLAKMASEQEKIREALKEMEKMQDKGKNNGGTDFGKLNKLMEENETDLLNKRLTQETINRQEDILTRLLQAEKAMREREMDEKRESKTAKELPRFTPPNITEYLKEKDNQIELLKTINPAFTPYYKKEINEYFNSL